MSKMQHMGMSVDVVMADLQSSSKRSNRRLESSGRRRSTASTMNSAVLALFLLFMADNFVGMSFKPD